MRPVRWAVEIFRFRTVRLDLRENTTRLTETLQALWRVTAGANGGTPPDPASAAWKNWIMAAELGRPLPANHARPALPPEALETLGMFELASDKSKEFDREAFGCFILSMTRSVADILGAYLLAKHAGLFLTRRALRPAPCRSCRCLRPSRICAAAGIIRELSLPVVRRNARDHGGIQEIMLGYSDSNKDGGFFCLHIRADQGQRDIVAAAHEAGIAVSFFHGRGGSVSRGGAPTGRAIAAQPAGTVAGRLRVTEQGEVVSSKFANRGTALYNMELLSASRHRPYAQIGARARAQGQPRFRSTRSRSCRSRRGANTAS